MIINCVIFYLFSRSALLGGSIGLHGFNTIGAVYTVPLFYVLQSVVTNKQFAVILQ